MNANTITPFILLIQCPDQPGIVARLSKWVFDEGCTIVASSQHSTDPLEGQFFMRLAFHAVENDLALTTLSHHFAPLGDALKATWSLHEANRPLRAGILVSKTDHCLFELLYRWQSGDLNITIPFIISNHLNCEKLAKQYEIPFHYLPVDRENRQKQENEILTLAQNTTDFLVLARYMRILSPNFIKAINKPIINIHHSFLPSFIGQNPYEQAYQRGVKLIGATAHYVTEGLDEGPIIAQMVERVSHQDPPKTLKRIGKHLEKHTLLSALEAHVNHRVIQHCNKTIVFD